MSEAYIFDFTRTPIGRYGGALKEVRADDLAAHPLRVLKERNPGIDWEAVDDVILGCANQAGEDNRDVARMAVLLAGLPVSVPGTTINRLCGSGLDAVGMAARAVKTGDAQTVIKEYLAEHPEVAALVLGAAADGGPGPLVTHFSSHAGHLACPLFIVPGGLSDEEISRVAAGPDAQEWDPFEAHLLRAVDELHDDACVTEPTYTAIAARYDEQQMLDLVFTVGQYHLVSMALNTFRVERDDGVTGMPIPDR